MIRQKNGIFNKLLLSFRPLFFVTTLFSVEIIILVGVFVWLLFQNYSRSLILSGWGIAIFLSLLIYISFVKIIINMKKAIFVNNKQLQQNNLIVHEMLEQFAKVGYIFYDNSQKIIFMSKFAEQNFGDDLYGKSISELVPEITSRKNHDYKVSLHLNQNHYKLICLSKYNVIMVKNCTVFEKAAAALNNNLSAIIIYNLNNLSTALDIMTEQEKSDYIYKTTAGILALCKKYNMFVIKPTPNQFLVIANQLKINKIIARKEFKRILLDFNEMNTADKATIQLSVAGAFGLNNLNILYEEALKNLQICSQRGGNQAIITNCITKENITICVDQSSVAETQIMNITSFASALEYKISRAKNVIIMGHKNLDFDCLGAGLGLIELCKIYKKQAKIILDEKTISNEYKKIINQHFNTNIYHDTFIKNKNILKSEFYDSSKTLLLITDVSNRSLFDNIELFRKTKHFQIIDHHYLPIGKVEQLENYFIDSNTSSTCEIIIYLLNLEMKKHHLPLELPAFVPTFLYMGMYIDTNDFKKQTTSATFTAAALLKKWGLDQANINKIIQINKSSFKRILELKSQFAEPMENILFCCDNNEEQIYQKHEIAITCEELLQRKNSFIAVAIAYTGKEEISASLRSINKNVNVQQVAEKLGGGGSKNSAAILMKYTKPSQLKKKIISILKNEVIINSHII